MKYIKLLGLLSLICFTFFYTEKIISISINQDEIMLKLNTIKENYKINPIDAIIKEDTIIPGKIGKSINIDYSYKEMKKIGYFEESLIKYEDIYPNISINNNYNKYIIKGNPYNKNISLIYIINNDKTLNTITNILKNKNVPISFFIDSTYLYNNIDIINKLNNYEIYHYGNNGKYTKDNIIITNNIINNKSNNKSIYCLFLEKNISSLDNCKDNKMFSIIPSIQGTYNDIKNNIENGSIILIKNTQELSNIIDYIKSKGYTIETLSKTITE